MIQIKHNKLRIPTGGRLTSWLFTKRGGVEFGATEDKSIQWKGGGLQVQRPTTRPRHARLALIKKNPSMGLSVCTPVDRK